MARTSGTLQVVIPGLVLVLALTGCASTEPDTAEDQLKALRKEVSECITDEERARNILGHVDQMEQLLVELGEVVSRHNSEIRAMVRDYSCTRPEMEEAFARFLDERRRIAASLSDVHYKLKAQTTPEEWKKLADKEKAAIDWAASQNLGATPLAEGSA